VSLSSLHLAACQGELPTSLAATSAVWGKSIVYAARTVTVPDTTPWLDQGVRDVPHPGEVIHAGHPICTVLAAEPSRAACKMALRREAARIRAACTPVSQGDAVAESESED
jgi:uncharacterized protein